MLKGDGTPNLILAFIEKGGMHLKEINKPLSCDRERRSIKNEAETGGDNLLTLPDHAAWNAYEVSEVFVPNSTGKKEKNHD
jgi:hypothetical protein